MKLIKWHPLPLLYPNGNVRTTRLPIVGQNSWVNSHFGVALPESESVFYNNGATVIMYPPKAKQRLNIRGTATWDELLDVLDCASAEEISRDMICFLMGTKNRTYGNEGRLPLAIYEGLFVKTTADSNGFDEWDQIRIILQVP